MLESLRRCLQALQIPERVARRAKKYAAHVVVHADDFVALGVEVRHRLPSRSATASGHQNLHARTSPLKACHAASRHLPEMIWTALRIERGPLLRAAPPLLSWTIREGSRWTAPVQRSELPAGVPLPRMQLPASPCASDVSEAPDRTRIRAINLVFLRELSAKFARMPTPQEEP